MKKKKEYDENHLSFGKLLLWKSSDVSAAWVNVIALTYLSVYASDTLGIDIRLVGTLLLASKIIDAITDLFAGILVDNTHTKWGKGRPYEIAIVGETLCTLLMFAVSPSWSLVTKCVWLFITYMFTYSIFATLRNAANVPYTIRAFSNNQIVIRKVASYGGIITMAASIVLTIVFPILVSKIATSAAGWVAAVAIIMIPATLIGVLRFFFIKEDPKVDAEAIQEPIRFKELGLLFRKNKYVWFFAFMMLAFNLMTNLAVGTYYFKWILGNIGLMSVFSAISMLTLPVMVVFPKIMQKIGMCRMIILFAIMSIVGYGAIFFAGSNMIIIMIGGVFSSLATLPLSYYGVLFIMNICDYNEIIGIPRMDGSSQILSNLSSKVGAALGSFITGIVLAAGGYVSAAGVTEQPVSALLAIRADYALIPIVLLVVIIFCCKEFEKLEKLLAEKKAAQTVKAASAEK
jgi:probable glucitol transport protein GutA